MTSDRFEAVADIIDGLGHALVEIVGGDPNGILYYAEVEEGVIFHALYKNEGNAVRYVRDPEAVLPDLIWDLWHAEDEDKRWATMEYWIEKAQVKVEYRFPDEVDVRDFDAAEEREAGAFKKHFGEKPILWPTLGENGFELSPGSN